MSAAIPITRLDRTAAELRHFVSKCGDGAQVRRLLAIALVLDGHSRAAAAEQNGMDRQTLSDWVHRYNATGIDGLKSYHGPGATPLLTEAEKAELKALVVKGPDPEKDKVIRWRCLDLQVEIARRFSVRVHESTVGKWLRQYGLTRLQARPCHPKSDHVAQEAFKKDFASLMKNALLGTTAGTPIEVWFQDEARVGQKGSLTHVWAPIGSCPLMVRDNRHDSAYLFGAICPARAVGAAIIMPAANAEAMNQHLTEISTQVASGAHAVVVCDRAGWHQTGGRLRVPDNITLLPLPSYAPELNPMENVWEYLRGNKLSRLVWDSYDAIVTACKEGWNFLINDPDRIRSIGHRDWACVNV
jgi:transposase